MKRPKTCVVDDDHKIRSLFVNILRTAGYKVEEAENGRKCIELVRIRPPDLIFLDLYLPDLSGLQVLQEVTKLNPGIQVIMMTGRGDIGTAVEAMKLGAIDYLLKPFDNEQILSAVRSLKTKTAMLEVSIAESIVGQSPQLNEIWSQISHCAYPDIRVMLLGESGTGKELFARAIHERSKRLDKPFVALDCAVLPDALIESEIFGHEKGAFTGALEMRIGKFELAQGGTLFLDEIGNLPGTAQAKLLRVLQEQCINRLGGGKPIKVDVRVISATNLNIEQAIEKGAFREDLFFRLAEFVIRLPPLRERKGDIQVLADYFVKEFSERFGRRIQGISDSAWQTLLHHQWPGNVRELENVIKSSIIVADDYIEQNHLPEYLQGFRNKSMAEVQQRNLRDRLRHAVSSAIQAGSLDLKALVSEYSKEIEREVLEELLRSRHFTQNELANFLNIDSKTLRTRLQKFGFNTRQSKA